MRLQTLVIGFSTLNPGVTLCALLLTSFFIGP